MADRKGRTERKVTNRISNKEDIKEPNPPVPTPRGQISDAFSSLENSISVLEDRAEGLIQGIASVLVPEDIDADNKGSIDEDCTFSNSDITDRVKSLIDRIDHIDYEINYAFKKLAL